MSTSILYHGFGIRGYRYLKTEYKEGEIIFHIEKAKGSQYCGECNSRAVIKKGLVIRKLRTLPIGPKRVFLMVHLHRLLCRHCEALRLEPLLLSFPKKHWTKNLGRYIVDLLRRSTVEDVARHLGMSWDTVKDIHKWALTMKYKKRKMDHLSHLGVDEIAVRKGHSYLTVVIDLDTGQVVWVAEGRKSSSLEPFLIKLKKAKAPIKAIAMDMWPAYITAVMKHYSYRCIVFDPYHVIASCNKMLDALRCQEAAAAAREQKDVYTGTRYLLLKGGEKLTNNTQAKEKLENLLSLNESLNMAYILKEELRRFWRCTTRKKAKSYLMNWLYKAWISGIKPLAKFATMIASHHEGILNYFDHRVSTGKVEGINNKIKVLKRQAYGFRDTEYFKLRIYSLHESRYALIG